MLTGKQRSILRLMGNDLDPILTVGKNGITDNLIEQLDQALSARELIKGRVLPHGAFDVTEVATELAAKTEAELVQIIGRNMLFYRAPRPGTASKLNWLQEEK